jgi:hypothetical protein
MNRLAFGGVRFDRPAGVGGTLSHDPANLSGKDWFNSRIFTAIGWAVLCAFMCGQMLSCFGTPVGEYDEAIPLVSSELVSLGRTPSVDFNSFYPPLYYFVIAEGFRMIGRSVLVIRFSNAALYLIVMAAVILFFRSNFSNLRPLIPYMGLAVAVAIGPATSPAWPAFALALLSLFAYLQCRHSSRPAWLWLVVAGALAGLSTLIRFNFGPYVAAVVGIDILLTEVLRSPKSSMGTGVRRVLLQIAAFAAPFALVNLAFYLSIYGVHAITTPWHVVSYSMRVMSSYGFKRVGPQMEILLPLGFPYAWSFVRRLIRLDSLTTDAVIPAAATAALFMLAFVGGGRPSVALWFPALGFLTVIALHVFSSPFPHDVLCLLLFHVGLQHYLLSRADDAHTILFFPVIALTLPFLFVSPAGANGDTPGYPTSSRGLLFLALIATAYAMLASKPDLHPPATLPWKVLKSLSSGSLDPRVPDRTRLPLIDPTLKDEIRATEFVRQRTPPSAPIFVGVTDHSTSFINDVRAYWLSERLPGVTYVNTDSGIAGRETVQREIVAELQRNHVNWAILYDWSGSWADSLFPNLSPGSKVLDEFLKSDFQEQAHFGRYIVVARKQP